MRIEINTREYELSHGTSFKHTKGCYGFTDKKDSTAKESKEHWFFAPFGTFSQCRKLAEKRFPNATTLYLLP